MRQRRVQPLAQLLTVIADTGASIKQVEHDRHFGPPDVASVAVNCIIETNDFEHIARVRAAIQKAGIDVRPETL